MSRIERRKIKGAFSGSSLYFLIQAGAAEGFTECGYEFEEVAGTSGGALVASAIASGVAPGVDMRDLVLRLFPVSDNLFDKSRWPWPGYGLVRGKKIESELRKHLSRKFSLTRIPLAVFTSNVDRSESKEWSTSATPNMDLPARVVDSMRIPGMFKARRIDGEDHVDGGVSNNIPADYWSSPAAQDNAARDSNVFLFLFRGTANARVGPRLVPWWLKFMPKWVADFINTKRYATGLLNALMNATSREHIEDAIWAKTVILTPSRDMQDRGLVASNFDLTRAEAEELIDEGRRIAIEWLEEHEPDWISTWRAAR